MKTELQLNKKDVMLLLNLIRREVRNLSVGFCTDDYDGYRENLESLEHRLSDLQ